MKHDLSFRDTDNPSALLAMALTAVALLMLFN
jgi:hypothetical protein